MNLVTPEDDGLIAAEAQRFLRERDAAAPAAVRWREFIELGWLSLPVPERAGGSGASDSTLAALLEQLGRARCNEPYLPIAIMAAGLLGRLETPLAERLLRGVMSGESRAVAALEPCLRVRRAGEDWRLTGAEPLVLGGDVASDFLLPALDGDGKLRLFCVAHDAAGVERRSVPALGACDAADLTLSDARAVLLTDVQVPELIAWTADRATAMACADAVGAISALVAATFSYTETRVQFGKRLSQFQVVEHYRAELAVCREEARAAAQLAVAAIDAGTAFRQRAISAAKVKVGQAARTVAHQAIQLHGAMGVTDELEIGHYAKRLLAFGALWGTRDAHLARYAGLARNDAAATRYLADAASPSADAPLSAAAPTAVAPAGALALDASALEFRAQARAFLRDALAPALSHAQQLTTTVYPEADVADRWHRRLHARGWSAPNWPAEHGGTGWGPVARYLWAQESGAAGAPVISPLGLPLVGPVLMHFGSAAQQARYLPAILSGDELWCQGFSEPGAGSDLAALATRAEIDGTDYVVNGTKIWTTHGHFAHFMAALIRTGPAGGRREGISFLLIDMRSPGITIRPIDTIGGDHELNQIFFDAVRVPVDNRVGAEGQGWEIAKFMLDYERGGDIMSAGHRRLMAELREIALTRSLDDSHAFWRAFAETSIDIDTLEMLELRALLGADERSAAAPSILKLRASEIQQAVTELGVRVLGSDAVRWVARRPLYAEPGARAEEALVARYLNSRANTIFGGSREIQKTLIARAAAG